MARSNKVLTAGFILLVATGIITVTVYSAVYIANRESHKAAPIPSCPAGHHSVHKVIIQNNKVIPVNTVAPLCDTLTITNLDDKERLMAFGLHEHHVPYDGTTAKILIQGQSLTVTLVQAGNFRFHDHWHDEIQGTFTVTKAD
jgi:hypothetical protein